MPLLSISRLKKSFRSPNGGQKIIVDVPEFHLEPGEHVGIRGESGCGKTTFLHLIAGILTADSGAIVVNGHDMTTASEPQRDRLRAESIGYIHQTFNLLQGYTCRENVLLGMAFGGSPDKHRAAELLTRVGLANRLDHRPRQLSTGQQQRVAIARALANRPKLVLADEPTGNLDPKNAADAIALIRETCREAGAALLLVSHEGNALSSFDIVRDFSSVNRASALV